MHGVFRLILSDAFMWPPFLCHCTFAIYNTRGRLKAGKFVIRRFLFLRLIISLSSSIIHSIVPHSDVIAYRFGPWRLKIRVKNKTNKQTHGPTPRTWCHNGSLEIVKKRKNILQFICTPNNWKGVHAKFKTKYDDGVEIRFIKFYYVNCIKKLLKLKNLRN